jgi:hypothetical protein
MASLELGSDAANVCRSGDIIVTPMFDGYHLERVTATTPDLRSEYVTTVRTAREAGLKADELTSPSGAAVWLGFEGTTDLVAMPRRPAKG